METSGRMAVCTPRRELPEGNRLASIQFRTPSLQNSRKINFCCSSHPAWDPSVWPPQHTNTPLKENRTGSQRKRIYVKWWSMSHKKFPFSLSGTGPQVTFKGQSILFAVSGIVCSLSQTLPHHGETFHFFATGDVSITVHMPLTM